MWQAGQGASKAHASPNVFSAFQKTSSRNPQDSAVLFAAVQFLTKGNTNKTQKLTLTKAIPLL